MYLINIFLISLMSSLLVSCVMVTNKDLVKPGFAGCNSETGLSEPLPTCSKSNPCTNLIGRDPKITNASDIPICKANGGERGNYNDGPAKVWTDMDGIKRYYCSFEPEFGNARVPLVIFLHGANGKAQDVYTSTSLRKKAFNKAFILVAPQGRNLHWPNFPDGSHWDIYYRYYNYNRDFALLDEIIDRYVNEGKADPSMIYVVGWSNGAFMASQYSYIRHLAGTPGGHHVAASAAYAGGDPFNNITSEHTPSCALNPYPRSFVPTYFVSRTCDSAVGCNETQRVNFDRPPGYASKEWYQVMRSQGSERSRLVLIDHKGRERNKCTSESFCSKGIGLANHVKWPDGIADGGGIDWEEPMLKYLFDHQLK